MKRLILILAFCLAPSLGWAQAAFQPVPGTVGGATGAPYASAASNNSTSVKGSSGTVYQIIAINTTTTVYYLRTYDSATAPTCSSSTGVNGYFPVPFGASNAGGGYSLPIPVGLGFKNGIGFCLTGAAGLNDNTNAATGVAINIVYQ